MVLLRFFSDAPPLSKLSPRQRKGMIAVIEETEPKATKAAVPLKITAFKC